MKSLFMESTMPAIKLIHETWSVSRCQSYNLQIAIAPSIFIWPINLTI